MLTGHLLVFDAIQIIFHLESIVAVAATLSPPKSEDAWL